MKRDYFQIAVNKELEVGELKNKLIKLKKHFDNLIIWYCIFFLIIGLIFLTIQFNLGYKEGIVEGKIQSINSCIN